ncbi:MAG: beta-mannosidase, partial [Patiriisocius sp.]
GTLYWQLNDCWPVVSWSSIDGLGNWKALHYKVKEAFEDVLIIVKQDKENLKVFIKNDSFENLNDTITIEIISFDGNILFSNTKNVGFPGNKSVGVWEKPIRFFDPFDLQRSVMKLTYGNNTTLHYFTNPKSLRLPKEQLDIDYTVSEKGILYTVSSKTLQKNVYLYIDGTAHFSDNFFDLLPGETKQVMLEFKNEVQKKIKYKTLNGVQNRLKPLQ